MEHYLEFTQSQHVLTLACHSDAEIWTANVYFATDDVGTMFFVSPKDTKHSALIFKNSAIAFSSAWFDAADHKNRKSIQGLGMCRLASTEKEIETGIALLYKKFPDMHDTLTLKWILTNAWGTRVWVIKPTFIKYWDDELYGDEESAEFTF